MHSIEYDIAQFNIKILNIKLKKLDLIEDMLMASKPPIMLKNKYKIWEEKLNKLVKEKNILRNELMIEYKKAEKILGLK